MGFGGSEGSAGKTQGGIDHVKGKHLVSFKIAFVHFDSGFSGLPSGGSVIKRIQEQIP